jgi:hypothetical protein
MVIGLLRVGRASAAGRYSVASLRAQADVAEEFLSLLAKVLTTC